MRATPSIELDAVAGPGPASSTATQAGAQLPDTAIQLDARGLDVQAGRRRGVAKGANRVQEVAISPQATTRSSHSGPPSMAGKYYLPVFVLYGSIVRYC